jgi:transcription antitermination factor NusG
MNRRAGVDNGEKVRIIDGEFKAVLGLNAAGSELTLSVEIHRESTRICETVPHRVLPIH